jgi:hypothetical protein
VIGDKDIKATEAVDDFIHKLCGGGSAGEIASQCDAVIAAEFTDQLLGLGVRFFVGEQYASAGFDKHADGGGTDAARASGDQRYFIFKGKRDRHEISFRLLLGSCKRAAGAKADADTRDGWSGAGKLQLV